MSKNTADAITQSNTFKVYKGVRNAKVVEKLQFIYSVYDLGSGRFFKSRARMMVVFQKSYYLFVNMSCSWHLFFCILVLYIYVSAAI
ncbi:MAG: hypothetical protein LBU60_01470 [Clostridiales bacterium]|nr:hypothetical protein [Clostridiales bacterium]